MRFSFLTKDAQTKFKVKQRLATEGLRELRRHPNPIVTFTYLFFSFEVRKYRTPWYLCKSRLDTEFGYELNVNSLLNQNHNFL